MLKYQEVLIKLLSQVEALEIGSALQNLTEIDLGEFFFNSSFLVTAMQFLKEEHWLQNGHNTNPENFKNFIIQIFQNELSPVPFLQNFFENSSVQKSSVIAKQATLIEDIVLKIVKSRSFAKQKIFATYSLYRMSALFKYEIKMQQQKKNQDLHLGISFYRTFDRLDEIFNLNYQADHGMVDPLKNTERLYAGAGVGVQSGYSTILTALHNLKLNSGDRLIDLGSGYGRVGLVAGLMHDHINFTGYEFVQHRVDIANLASQNFNLSDRIKFLTCDLSNPDFQIPDAEVYYLYDPFSEETYLYILSQLVNISRRQKITIVTKGNARAKLLEVATRERWPAPREFDSGNLCMFETT